MYYGISTVIEVSTHSRLKAAGIAPPSEYYEWDGFNTQPPEGGWLRGGKRQYAVKSVSTHSRLKAAGLKGILLIY